MKRFVTKTVPFDLIDHYLSFKPELNILLDQYNFPNEYSPKDYMESIYDDGLRDLIVMIEIKLKLEQNTFSFQDIALISKQEFRDLMLAYLPRPSGKDITGYRITGSNIMPGNVMLYRIDIYIRDEDSKETPLYTGLFGENTYSDTEDDINIHFKAIKRTKNKPSIDEF